MKKGRGEGPAGHGNGLAGRGLAREKERAFFPPVSGGRAQRGEPREKSAWILAATAGRDAAGRKKCGRHVHPREPNARRGGGEGRGRASGRRDTAKPMFPMKGNMKYESADGARQPGMRKDQFLVDFARRGGKHAHRIYDFASGE